MIARAAKATPIIDVAIVAMIMALGVAYYGNIYRQNEPAFSFYQKYFYSAVNIYCIGSPEMRKYNSPWDHETGERIDPNKMSCDGLKDSPKVEGSYYNGWHDTHPILSTLIGYNWKLLGFRWDALWPIAGFLASLAIVAFYVILRCFAFPWPVSLVLLPAVIPFPLINHNIYYLRDFSKVPFILLGFGFLGFLFRPGLSGRHRTLALVGATITIALGSGFRQDTIVLLPIIVVAAALTACRRGQGLWFQLIKDLATIGATFVLAIGALGALKTDQVAQLQGYPHFIVQGFADVFWQQANSAVPGISFMALYSDMLAYAAVNATSKEDIGYFAGLDPRYTGAGLDLSARYAALSAADMVLRIFSGLSTVTHSNAWIIEKLSNWLLLLLALIGLRRWRLAYFIAALLAGLAAAGSIQFDRRHILHLIALDRALFVIAMGALISAGWRFILSPKRPRVMFAIGSLIGASAVLMICIVTGFLVQHGSLTKLADAMNSVEWLPSEAAYRTRYPANKEAIVRYTIDTAKCPNAEIVLTVEGQRVAKPLGPGKSPRQVFAAQFDSQISKVSVAVSPTTCLLEEAWGPLGDGTLTPLQLFDPQAALAGSSLERLSRDLLSSFR